MVHAVPPPWLDAAVAEQAYQTGPDVVPVDGPYRGVAHDDGDRSQWHVPLEAGRCYLFSAAGDATVEALALYLWKPEPDGKRAETGGGSADLHPGPSTWKPEPDGKRAETVRGKTPRTLLVHCAQMTGPYLVEAKVARGYGHYQLGVFTRAGIVPAPLPPPPPLPPPSADVPPARDLAEAVEEMAASVAPGANRIGELFDGRAVRTDWYVELDGNRCYWLIGAGDEGIEQLSIYLWNAAGERITANKSETNRVSVGHCPDASGMYQFQAKVASGAGRYVVGVYARER